MKGILMEKRIFTIILVVTVGVLVGVAVVKKQAREPLLRELLKRQNIMLGNQGRMEIKLTQGPGIGGSDNIQIAALVQKQVNLESRIAAIESQLKDIQKVAKLGKGSGGNARQAAPPVEDLSKVYDIAVAHSPVKGKKNAPVTIVEFIDFQCPYCARFHPPVVEVLKAYPDKVNYMVKNFPLSFHPEAKPAAKIAFAAGEQGKYWEMVDALLENGRNLNAAKYDELAELLKLNMKKFKADIKSKDSKWEEFIQKDMALASQVNVRGTPTIYINGKKTRARDVSSFKKEIDAILNKK